jgi:peptidoglycan L-alanyl-D-glutamate endopeptidase CwlK
MTFLLSARSERALQGVHPDLVRVVRRAIQLTAVDFGVVEGLRTQARQAELVKSGASQTMASRHLTGHAVDLMAYIGDRASWELPLYDDIADAMRAAAKELQVPVRWGAAWSVNDIRGWYGTMESALHSYVDACRKAGGRPFLDGPHFELPAAQYA